MPVIKDLTAQAVREPVSGPPWTAADALVGLSDKRQY